MPASSKTRATSKTQAASKTQDSSKPVTPLPPAASHVGKAPSKEAPKRKPGQKPQPIQNRVKVLLVHIPKFSIQGQARLATEVGVSRSTISRLVHGRINPSYRLARGVTDVLERMLGKPLDMREVFSTDGTYLTPSGCALCRCHGCLPDVAWEDEGRLKPGWEDARPGDWSLARTGTPEPQREEEPCEEEPCKEEEQNGGFSGYGEAEDDDEEVLAEHWEAKLKSSKLRDLQGSAR